MSSRGLYDPYDVIGGDFWVKNIKYFIFILFLAPKKFFEKLARAENFDPIFDPPSSCEKHFLGGRPHFQKMPQGQLRVGAKFKENRLCRFPAYQFAWILA